MLCAMESRLQLDQAGLESVTARSEDPRLSHRLTRDHTDLEQFLHHNVHTSSEQ